METQCLPLRLLSALYPKVTVLFNINFAPPNQTYPVCVCVCVCVCVREREKFGRLGEWREGDIFIYNKIQFQNNLLKFWVNILLNFLEIRKNANWKKLEKIFKKFWVNFT